MRYIQGQRTGKTSKFGRKERNTKSAEKSVAIC